MERFLVALDCRSGPQRSIQFLNRVMGGVRNVHLTLFHALPPVSPNLLRREAIERIEALHLEKPHLNGYFWGEAPEREMHRTFKEARGLLLEGGFSEEQIGEHFCIRYDEVSQVILKECKSLACSTIVLERRRLGIVKELLSGSISSAVLKHALGITVWVVDN